MLKSSNLDYKSSSSMLKACAWNEYVCTCKYMQNSMAQNVSRSTFFLIRSQTVTKHFVETVSSVNHRKKPIHKKNTCWLRMDQNLDYVTFRLRFWCNFSIVYRMNTRMIIIINGNEVIDGLERYIDFSPIINKVMQFVVYRQKGIHFAVLMFNMIETYH